MAETTDLHAQLAEHVADLAKKHASVSYLVLGVLGLLLVLGTFGGYMALKSYDAQLARAEVREQQYDADRKSWQEELKARDAERAADAQRVEVLMGQIAARAAQPLPPVVKAGLAPTATVLEASEALGSVMSDRPTFGTLNIAPDGNASLRLPQLQILVSDEVDLKRLKLDFSDSQKAVELEKGINSSLANDLSQCKSLNADADKTIADYKRLAKKSKWKKFLSGAEKVALVAGGIYIGHKL